MIKFKLGLFSKTCSALKITRYIILSTLENSIYRYRLNKRIRKRIFLPESKLEAIGSSIYYINLDSRIDRLEQLQANFDERQFPTTIRQSGVKKTNGALGCALSHVKVLEDFLSDPTRELLLVVEDDCRFLISFSELSKLLTEFLSAQELCVLVICPSVQGLRIQFSKNLDVSNNIQTTACYAVKRYYAPTLLENFKESVTKLELGSPRNHSAIDINWKKLQQRFLFAIPRERIAFQEPSYSDIENRLVDYE
jgi:hypothetical protein